MKESSAFLVFLLFLLLEPSSTGLPGSSNNVQSSLTDIDFAVIEQLNLDNNFENGTLQPWVDASEPGAQWIIQDSSTWNNERMTIQQELPTILITAPIIRG